MRAFIIAILLSVTLLSFSQRRNGMITDNYAGYSAAEINPANLADSRFRFNMNIIGFNTHLQNNYIQLETPHSIYKFLYWNWDSTFGTQNFDYPFKEYYVTERLNGSSKYMYTNTQANVLNMQFGLSDRSGISFGISNKVFGKVSHLPEDALKTFLQDLDTFGNIKANQERLLGKNITTKNMGAAGLAYLQYSLKYALVAREKRKDFIKVGFGLDYNLGLYGGYFKSKATDYTLTGIDTLVINSGDLELAYVNPRYIEDPSRRLNDFFGKSRLGRGVGINAGIVYEHRPDPKSYKYKMDRKNRIDHSQNKYDWKLAASITDLGFVNFKNTDAVRVISIPTIDSDKDWNDFDIADQWKGSDDLDTFLNTFFENANVDSTFIMYTPASLNLFGDYKWKEDIYISATYSQSLTRKSGKSVKMPSVLTIAPRYEKRWFTVSTPLSISRYYNLVNIGLYLRGGPFYIGSDNLGGFMGGTKTNGVNLYAGFNWPIHHNRLKDADGDQVSDNEDKCPNEAGSRYANGCPDSDGDKIADFEDKCPNEPGKKRTEGCPDYDDDGLVGDLDLCPELYGDESTSGCPDSDGDGIYDNIDKCPDIAGEAKFDGCADKIATSDNNSNNPEKDKTNVKTDNSANDIVNKDEPITTTSKFENWDFEIYTYWPVLGAYNDIRWAEELRSRLMTNLNLTTTLKSIPGVSTYYITLGEARTISEALEIQKTLDIPAVNSELNGSLWWKKVKK